MQPVGGVLATLVRPIGSLSISMIPITYNLSLGHLKYSSLLKYLSQSVCHNITHSSKSPLYTNTYNQMCRIHGGTWIGSKTLHSE